MSFSLSFKNIKKSFKDYAIYFLTLVFGVAIFYIFNSMDSQQAMMNISSSTNNLIELMINTLGGISVFVSFVLGFLIIYANNFLIKRRKKEFGVYMTLGMSKWKISKILVFETFMVGIISLIVGLMVGIFGSQLMSILVAKLFAADMSQYQFVFSSAALWKTALFFGIIYLCVMVFNTFAISKCKLINLITANRKSEKVKLKNPILCVILFLISVAMLIFAYYNVTNDFMELNNKKLCIMVIIGVIATFLFFWSLSGFILRIVQSSKKLYLKNLNLFVLRQLNDKINTTTVSVSLICLMLFLTICILSSAISMNDSMTKDLQKYTPVDVTLSKKMDVSGSYYNVPYSDEQIADSKISIMDSLKNVNFDTSYFFKDMLEVSVYATNDLTLEKTLGDSLPEVKKAFPFLKIDTAETLMRVSDYNKVAKLFDNETLTLGENQYIMLCNYDQMKEIRDGALKTGGKFTLNGKEYTSKTTSCVDGFIEISSQATNAGVIILPDDAIEEGWIELNYLHVNYNANTPEEVKQKEKEFVDWCNANEDNVFIDAMTKITLFDASRGLGAMVTFIGIYLGIIFLITSAAILALKELSESSDNKERYDVLRKIGADEKMIHKALFIQIGIFFLLPLLLAIIHSIFGMQVAYQILKSLGEQDLLPSIIITAIFLIGIYGCYFIATYLGSKAIIKEDE